MMTLYDKKMLAIREAEIERLPVPPRGALVEHVCPECGRRTPVRLTAEDESVRRVEWQTLTSPRALKCQVCGEAVDKREAAYWAASHRVELERTGRADEAKLTSSELRITRAGFPLLMTKFDRALAQDVGLRLYNWVYEHREENLWIADTNNIGKTRAVCAVGAALLMVGLNVKYFHALELQTSYVAVCQNDNREIKPFLNKLRCDLLIINDIGQGRRISGTAGEVYYKAFDQQIEDGKKFWATANLSPRSIGEMFEMDNTGEGFRSRIERAVLPGCDWAVYRDREKF